MGGLSLVLLVAIALLDRSCSASQERLHEQRVASQAVTDLVLEARASRSRRIISWLRARNDSERETFRKHMTVEDKLRPPTEQARLVAGLLAAPEAETKDVVVCRARELLALVPRAARGTPEVATAFALFRAREAAVLRRERAAAEETRGLLCADGRHSPCRCAGNHQGCCSHHGGVVGCTPLPTKVECGEGDMLAFRGF